VIERNGGDLGFEAELFKSGETKVPVATAWRQMSADRAEGGPPKGGFFLKRMTHRPAHREAGIFAKFQKLFFSCSKAYIAPSRCRNSRNGFCFHNSLGRELECSVSP